MIFTHRAGLLFPIQTPVASMAKQELLGVRPGHAESKQCNQVSQTSSGKHSNQGFHCELADSGVSTQFLAQIMDKPFVCTLPPENIPSPVATHELDKPASSPESVSLSINTATDGVPSPINNLADVEIDHEANTGDRTHSCVLCGARFNTWDAVDAHLQVHGVLKRVKCFQCELSFSHEQGLNDHIIRTHGIEQCHIASVGIKAVEPYVYGKQVTQDSDGLTWRTWSYTGDNSHPNGDKSHPYGDKSHPDGDKSHQCSVCGNRYSGRGTLRAHMKTHHTGEKPYRCTVCNITCNDTSQLKRHMMIHTGEKPYGCNYCNKQFNRAFTLRQHIMTHLGQKLHTCYVCRKGFNRATDHRKHMALHTQEEVQRAPFRPQNVNLFRH